MAGQGEEHLIEAGLADQGITAGEFSFGQPSLDEVFLALTSHPGTRAGTAPEATG